MGINHASMKHQARECIILAGGLGSRLQQAVPDLPKCLAPVAGRPFLSYIIDYLRLQGVQRFVFSLGYRHEAIEEFLESNASIDEVRLVFFSADDADAFSKNQAFSN